MITGHVCRCNGREEFGLEPFAVAKLPCRACENGEHDLCLIECEEV